MLPPVLPRAQSSANGGGPFTREWYDYFRAILPLLLEVVDAESSDAAQIASILARLDALEAETDATINGLASVEVFGSLESGLVQIQLEGDTDTPGNTYYYGTGPDGTKGWSTIASAFTEGAGITLTVGADGVTDIAHADTSSVADITATFTGGTVPDVISITFDEFGHVLTRTISGRTLDHNDTGALQGGTAGEFYHLTSAEYTKVQALPSASQPLDATLTALAGQNWAQNAFPIGTGADTVAQVAFAANTFPARASTGDLVAKSITDDALLLMADADVPRLGTANSWSGANTFTASPLKFAPTAGAGEQQIDVVASVTGDFTWLRGGVRRWQLRMNSTAESGGNVGSDLDLRYYTDGGVAALGARWARSTGILNFSLTPTVLTTPLALISASITNGDTTHAPSGDAVFDALAGKDDAGSAAAALVAAMDFTTDEIDAITPESIGMSAGFDSVASNRVVDLDAMLGGLPCFFSASSGATGIPVAQSGSGVFIPFSATLAIQIFATVTGVDANRRVFYRAANTTWGPWIEIAYRFWNATTAASGSITPNVETNDAVIRTAISAGITINNPTGTKQNGRSLTIRLRDNGTARALTWGSEYRSMTATLPTTTVANKTLYCQFIVNADETTLDLMNVQQQP